MNLTALIDVTFFLLIFFMTSARVSPRIRPGAELKLAASETAVEARDGPRKLVVEIDGKGGWRLDGAQLDPDKLAEGLRAGAGGATCRVEVRADGAVASGVVSAALQAAAEAGLPDVLLATRRATP